MQSSHSLGFRVLVQNFFLLGIIAFGPGMFSLIHQRVVEQKKWMSEDDFREAITFGELAPGPFTIHVVMYVGYFLKGFWGLILTTLAFVLPSLIIVILIAMSLNTVMKSVPGVEYFLIGVSGVILASMISTIIRVGEAVLKQPPLLMISVFAVAGIYFLKLNFIMLVAGSGLAYMAYMILKSKEISK